MEAGSYAEAVELFAESSRLAPHFKTFELLGECYLKLNQPSAAIVPLAAAVGLGSNAFRATYLLAEAYTAMNNRDKALEFATRALTLKPDFKRARELKEKLSKKVSPLRGLTP